MPEISLDANLTGVTAPTPTFKDHDIVVLGQVFEGPEIWHDYSVERGNETRLVAALPYGSVSGFTRTPDYSQSSAVPHGLWRG